ncbi:MAG TPA: tryptophan-rich sensory protein [Ktedonobacterales bacterium]|nr:tryptophan-rich sensory protein [Ktedonobacterales bacterium]
MNRDIARQATVVVSFVVTLVVNWLATTGALGGLTTREIATRYPIYFLPANFTFGIWGLIYLALGIYTVYQALPSQREQPRQRAVGWLVALTGVFNSLWLVTFQNTLFAASMLAMLALLVTLIVTYMRLDIGGAPVNLTTRLLLTLPFSLYLGWITVATIANASYVLYDAGWDGFGISGQVWAVIMLLVAAVLTLYVVATRGDVVFLLVVVWAFSGIWVRQQMDAPQVALVAGVGALALVVAGLISIVQSIVEQRGKGPGGVARLEHIRI